MDGMFSCVECGAQSSRWEGRRAPCGAWGSLEGVEEIVVNNEVVEGRAQPLYIYADRAEDNLEKGA